MRFETLDAWLTWQEELNPAEIKLGLERVQVVLQRMGLSSPDFAIITIAGTNGKGSSAAMLQAIYHAAGYRVGVYSSPHLHRYNERVTLNGVEVDDVMLCRAFEQVECARTQNSDELLLTYFEFGTLAAIAIFQQVGLDIAILEVGLGGRLDAVNVLQPDVALVTMVDLDHQAWLGDDRETIAREKAGIYRAGLPAVCAEPVPARSLVAHAAAIGAQFYTLNRQFSYGLNGDVDDGSWYWRSDERCYARLPPLGMMGAFQLQNAAGVLMVVELLQSRFAVELAQIETGLQQAQVAGRMQRIVIDGDGIAGVECLLDVAHNPSSARALAETLATQPCAGMTYAVIAMLADKDIAAVVAAMAAVVDGWYVASLNAPGRNGDGCPRGATVEAILPHLPKECVSAPQTLTNVAAACAAALQNATAGDRLIVFGSFYTVAAAKTFFDNEYCKRI